MARQYLHEVREVWFVRENKPKLRGRTERIRFADDFVVKCEKREDAAALLEAVAARFQPYGLTNRRSMVGAPGAGPDSVRHSAPRRPATKFENRTGRIFLPCCGMAMTDVVLRPIAELRTPFPEKFGVPRQSGLVPAAEGRVVFRPEFSAPEFTRGLEAFSHVWLITGFHGNPPWTGSAVVRPPRLGGNERVGVFASRSPNRPNGLGLSLVRVLGLEPGVVRVGGVDAVDGTPVYDLKPYLPWCEAPADATADWAQGAPAVRAPEAVTIPAELAEKLGPATTVLVRQVLRLELQPAYQSAEARSYGMTLAGWNVRWRAGAAGAVEVCEVTPV